MSNDGRVRRPGSVEILPPETSYGRLPAIDSREARALSFAITERLKLWGAQRVINGLALLYEAEDRAYEAATRRDEARERNAIQRARLDHLDDLRALAGRRVQHEIEMADLAMKKEKQAAKDELEKARSERDVNQLTREITRLREERKLANMVNPQEKKSAVEARIDQARRELTATKLVDELVAELVGKYGVEREEDLPPGERQIVERLRSQIEMGDVRA